LQREANRLYGYTAKQTLDYAQSLYEKKLATYPRTDSRYITADMAAGLPALVTSVAAALQFEDEQLQGANNMEYYGIWAVRGGGSVISCF
jgi:DNA topoisomerase IA